MQAHWLRLITDTEKRADTFLALQNRVESSPEFGSLTLEMGYPDPKPTLHFGGSALSVYLNPESRHYRNPAIPEAYAAALTYAERVQNPDGTFDYRPCNFQSPPDTAFIISRVVITHDLIVKTQDPAALRLLPRIVALIEKAGRGMATGGFHTPNHRWALAACLSSVARITGNSWFARQAEPFLREGIDNNEDGEYAERSAGGYNKVNNDQLVILAQELRDPSFLPHVDRNLEMMLTYLDPDRSIFTNNSTRQDRGVKVYLEEYFINYLVLGHRLKKPLYLAVARRILDDTIAAGRRAPDFLDQVMVQFGGLDYGKDLPAIPTTFTKHYWDSGIVRVGREGFSYSLLQNAGRFLYFQSGALACALKIAVVYFEKREFKAESITREGDAWVLRFTAQGWYYQAFPEAPPTSDWWAMDHSKRPQTPGPRLDFTVTVRERPEGDGIDVTTSCVGWTGVPLRFEVTVPPGTSIEGESFAVQGRPEDSVLVKSGPVHIRSDLDCLAVGPGFAEHRNTGGLYSESRSRDHHTLYFTGVTPFDRTISFRRPHPREGL